MTHAPRSGRALGLTALALSYPVLTHLGVHLGSVALICAALSVLVLLVLSAPLLAGRVWAWLVGVLALGMLVLLGRAGEVAEAGMLLFVPPVVLYLALAWFFGRTLLPGRQPLITRLVWHLHERPPALPDDIAAYTRTLTLLWVLLLTTIGTTNALLALLATPDGVLELMGYTPALTVPRTLWSIVAHFLSFTLVLVFMSGEYAWRWFRFPDERHRFRNVFDFIDRMRTTFPALLRDLAG
jgi:uncharacterized membrane protein